MLETKHLDLCKPMYKDIGNVVARCLYDYTKSIHKEGRGEKEEEGLKRDDDDSNDDMGEGEEREGAESLEDIFNGNDIYCAITSRGTTTTNNEAAKDDDDKEGRMVGILQL